MKAFELDVKILKIFINFRKIPGGYDKADIIHMLPTALGIFTENQWGAVDPNYLSTVNEILQMNSISVLDAVKAVGIVKTMECKLKIIKN